MAQQGLFGSTTGTNMVRAGIAEFVGTFILVFVGTAVASLATIGDATAGQAYDSLAVALAFGLALIAIVAAIGHISGAHVNPAVTLGLFAIGKFPGKYLPAYIGAQLLGAVAGAAATWAVVGNEARERANLGATTLSDGVSVTRGFTTEALIAFVLVFVVVAAATDKRVPKAVPPLAVGLALTLGVLIGGPITGGGVNPARAFGPSVLAQVADNLLVYMLAPLVGGVLAAVLYDKLLSDAKDPSEGEPSANGRRNNAKKTAPAKA